MKMALTAKQQRFVEEYCVDFNGTQAAIRSGYSADSAALIASQNIRKLHIRKAIDYQLAILAEQSGLSSKLILDRLKAEMLYFGEGSSHAARIRAAELLGKAVPGTFPPDEVKHKHGGDPDNETPIKHADVGTTVNRFADEADTVLEGAATGEPSRNGHL